MRQTKSENVKKDRRPEPNINSFEAEREEDRAIDYGSGQRHNFDAHSSWGVAGDRELSNDVKHPPLPQEDSYAGGQAEWGKGQYKEESKKPKA